MHVPILVYSLTSTYVALLYESSSHVAFIGRVEWITIHDEVGLSCLVSTRPCQPSLDRMYAS